MRLRAKLVVGSLAVLAGATLSATKPVAAQVMDRERYLYLFAEHFEQAPGLVGGPLRLEGEGWYGGNYDRLWLKVAGDVATRDDGGDLEVQALFGHLISPYWDLQTGVRVDGLWGKNGKVRSQAVVGLQGLAPYWFEVETALFVSDDGDVSARLEASYDLFVTQRLVLEPDFELNMGLQEVPAWGTGSGLTSSELGLRLRYEIRRELAPYVGYVWQQRHGGTASQARAGGQMPYRRSLVAGVTVWY